MNNLKRLFFIPNYCSKAIIRNILLLIVWLCPYILSAQKTLSIVSKVQIGAFPIVSKATATSILVEESNAEVVGITAEAVSSDIFRITGVKPSIIHDLKTAPQYLIIAGTLGTSAIIDQLVTSKKIDLSAIQNKWESFKIVTINNPFPNVKQALVIVGSDRRGTAYGLFEISRMAGVSPWTWWADVNPIPRKELFALSGNITVGEPSVKYRGIFINDEDWGLNAWAKRKMDTTIKDIGPNTYSHVFELLLRLRANMIWPAMHDSTKAFWYYKENPKVADKYGIVIGSTHCDMMLRSNTFEWGKNYEQEYAEKPNEYRYDKNKAQIYRYWEDRVKEAKNYETIYTIGMRGVRDGSIVGPTTKEGKIQLLDVIFKDERAIFERNLGGILNVPQIFCPYKEVLDLYRAGLKVPEDATLIWTDDNFGYIRQLSNPEEQKRSGASGVYYHLSYLGGPHDYLWLTTTSPSLISYEMTKAYQFGANRLWVLNVGDIKPSEMETQFFLDMAWDVKKWNPGNAWKYAEYWAGETFGKVLAPEIANIKNQYLQLAQNGKPEHLGILQFDDASKQERILAYDALIDQVERLKKKIQPYQKDAFFELIEYPVKGAGLMNRKIFYAEMSRQVATIDKKLAIAYSRKAEDSFKQIKSLTEYYNTGIQQGKWDHIITYFPRNLSVYGMPTVGAPEVLDSTSTIQKVYDRRYLDTTPIKAATKANAATKYTTDFQTKHEIVNEQIIAINGLGLGGKSITRYPFNGNSFKETAIDNAPYVEYNLSLKQGTYNLSIKCLPTHVIHAGRSLLLGVTINQEKPTFIDFNHPKEDKKWSANILRGYTESNIPLKIEHAGKTTVRIYLMDTGLALSRLDVEPLENDKP